MKLKYTAPCLDYSGYGEAARHDVGALVAAGCEVTTQIPNYTLETADFGRLGQLCKTLEGRPLGYKIKVIHTTPNVYPQYFEEDCYHIGRVFWETDKLPLDFAQQVEKCDEIWTGSEFNAQAIRNAGVTKPIYIIPEAIDCEVGDVEPYKTEATGFRFYSIFEFINRKNYAALLTAYWQEFTKKDDVSLTLKTYLDNFTPKKKLEIDMRIHAVKKQLGQSYYAPLFLYRGLMDRHQIYRFHKSFDCFVSAHRGEGWGVPQMEAMLLGHPIISTGCGGVHEYMTDGQEGVLVPYSLVKVEGEVRNQQWYRPDQKWAEVDIAALRRAMRRMYEDRDKVLTMGTKASLMVKEKFALPVVGHMMRSRLDAIAKSMEPHL